MELKAALFSVITWTLCVFCREITEELFRGISDKIPRTEIYALVGHPGKLPCNITPESDTDVVSLILWYNNKSPSPIYSLDARSGSVHYGRHWRSDDLASRAYFEMSFDPAYLKLDPVTEEDEGIFMCRVDFYKARTRYHEVGVNLIVPPSRPVIRDEIGESQQSLIGPYNEGDSLSLTCEVEGGSPQPNLTWWRESVLLDNSVEVKTTSYVKNILKIPSLQRHDLMAAFICEASNSEFSPPLSTSVTVDMNFRPLEVHLENGRHFSAGKPAEIECFTAGSRPPAKISWWKGNVRQMTAKSVVSVNGNSTTSILTFTPNMEDDGVYLSCAAENRLVPGSDMEDGIKLEIHYVPQVFLRLGSKLRHSHIQESNDVYLECNIRANPLATYIGWTFEGQEIYTNTTLGIIVSNQTLVLQKVKKSSRGHYTCTATNTEGQGESKNVFLRVQYTPICDSQQRFVYRTGINEPVQVTCKLKSDPTNVTFSWTFNNSYDNFEVFSFTTKGTTSTATYTPKSKYEFGTLICFGTNNVGTQKNPCRFSVIPAGIPEPVRNCSLFNQTDHEIGVECVKGDHGGFTQLFYAEIEEVNEQRKIFNMSSSSPAFYIKNLPPGTTFIFKVYSYNMEGRSEPVLFRGNTLDVRPSSSTGGVNWVFSVNVILIPMVSVCTVLIIVGGCAIFILKMKLVRTRDETGTVDNKINCTLKNHAPTEGNSKDLVQGKSPDVIPDVKYLKVPFRGIDQRRNSSQETSKDKNVVSPLKGKTNKTFQNYVQETVT